MSIRRTLQVASFAAACISLPLSQAHAQLTLSLGGGGTWPLGSLSNAYTTGYNVLASLGIGLPAWPVGLRVDGMFNQMKSQSGVDAGTLQMWTLNADFVYNIVPMKVAAVTPYLVAGGGYYNDAYHISATGTSIGGGGSTHDNDFGLNGGVGLRLGAPSLSIFIESRFHYIFLSGGHLEFIPLTAGVTF